jgi:hypothetical protein
LKAAGRARSMSRDQPFVCTPTRRASGEAGRHPHATSRARPAKDLAAICVACPLCVCLAMSDVLGSGVEFRSTTLGRESQNLGGAEVRERSQERSSCWSTARSGIAEFPRRGGETGCTSKQACAVGCSTLQCAQEGRVGGKRSDGGGMRPVAMTGVRDREIASDYEGGKGLCLVAWLESLKYFWRCLFAPFLHGLCLSARLRCDRGQADLRGLRSRTGTGTGTGTGSCTLIRRAPEG